jgi:hypothetical protein
MRLVDLRDHAVEALVLVVQKLGVADYAGEILDEAAIWRAAIGAGSPATGYVATPREALPGKERTA